MKKTDAQLKLFISAILLVLCMIMPAAAGTVIPDDVSSSNPYFITVANDGGASADIYGNDTYAMYYNGNNYGLTFETDNSYDYNDETGENLLLNTSDGSFYLNFYGGKGGVQRVILMLAVNGTVEDDFSAHFTATGYNVNYNSDSLFGSLWNHTASDISHETGVSEYFSKSDFTYGSQVTRPPEETAIYHDQDINDTETFQVMFIDTGLGILGNKISDHTDIENPDLTDTGKLKIDYHLENLGDSVAVIDAYGWIYSGFNSPDYLNPSISWTNLESTDGEVRILVGNETLMEQPVASFTADSRWGEAPFTVRFTDTSSGYPTSWFWDFGDGENSTGQNPLHTYDTPGTYTISLTTTNSGGSNTTTLTDYITAGVVGGSLLSDSAWPELGYDSQNTGRSPYDGPQVYAEKWITTIGAVKYSSPTIDSEGIIYIGSTDDYLYAIYPNGTIKWTYTAPDDVANTPALCSDGTIYFGSGTYLVALNPDGTEKWTLEGGGYKYCSPAIGSDGTIYAASSEDEIIAVYPNGTLKWSYPTGGSICYNGPAIGFDGTIYMPSDDGNLYALNPDGTLKWTYQTGTNCFRTTPVVGSDGTVYAECYDGYVYAISSEGALKWKYEASSNNFYYGGPAIGSDDTIYIAEYKGGNLHALNPDGTLKWTCPIEDTYVKGAPIIGSDGTIYISSYTSSSAGNIYAVNPDGSIKWKQALATRSWASTTIGSDGTLYFGSYHGYLYAIENVVDFTTDKTSGESSLTVQFTGTSSRNVSSWYWDFGDGINSTLQNPSHEYSSDGSYTVNLTITEEGTGEIFSAEKPGWIKAYTAPVASFTADVASGQVPLTVNFTDTSTNNPTEWLWDFGDGNTSTKQNPEYAYITSGTFSVTLYTENPAGNDTYIANNYITAEAQPVPVVDFNSSITDGQVPLEVTFTDLSTESPISWLWDFGDGGNSTAQNPVHTYEAYGNYTVELTAANYGGSNSTAKTAFICVCLQDLPVTSMSANKTSGLTPFSVAFTDTSSGYNITGWFWDFGDGTNSTEQSPEHTYTIGGDFIVSLNATNDGGSNESTLLISVSDVHPPLIEFSANRTWGKYPLAVEFTDESTLGPIQWLWDFGDGMNSTEQNPVHTFQDIGEYNVTLTAINDEGGNTSTKANYIHVGETYAKPYPEGQSLNLYVANDEGVKYNVANGVTSSSYAPYVFINNTYHQLYNGGGGGTNALHVSNDPSNRYGQIIQTTNQSGEFWLTFTGGQPNLHDAVLLLAVNGEIPDDFTVRIRSTGYDFEPPIPSVGNNNTIGTPNFVEGAIDQTFERKDFIYGPSTWRPHRANYYPVVVGQNMSDTSNTFEMMFIDLRVGCTQTLSDGYVRVEYEFNNLTTFAVFNAYGWYSASNHGTGLIMTTSGTECQVTGISEVPVADFTVSNTTGNVLVPIQFTDTSINTPQSWFWDFGDGTTSEEQNPEHTFTSAGTYTVNLTATNIRGSDSKSVEIVQVVGDPPVTGFTTDVTSGVSPLKVTFIDKTTNSPLIWFWDFGDGTNSTEQNPVHWYAPGTYTVTLTATNGGGSDTFVKSDYISVSSSGADGRFINPDFETGDLTGWESGSYASISNGQIHNGSHSVFFNYQGNNPYSNNYVAQHVDLTDVSSISFWGYQTDSFGTQYFRIYIDGTLVQTDTCVPLTWTQYTIPVADYTGVHEVRIGFDRNMYAIDSYIDDLSISIDSSAPVAGFTATPVSGTAPLSVRFTDTSSKYPTEWFWDFDNDGSADSTEQNPVHTYSNLGTYSVKLTVKNSDGSNSLVKSNYITVKGVQKTTKEIEVKNNGTLTDNGNGRKQYSINQSGAQADGNNVVINSGNYTITIKSDKAPSSSGGNYVSDVTGIGLEVDPVEVILDGIGNVSGFVNLELNDLPGNSKLEITLEKGNSGKGTDFQLAAGASGLNVGSVAYTMNVVKTNLTNGQEIKEARITMSAPESWVNSHGGTSAIRIIRIAEDGTKEVLDTTCLGTGNGIMTFEGYSPNGLSLFGLASATQQTGSTQSSASYSSGTLAASGGGTSDIGIDGAENLKAGDMATLHFDETSIYEIDLYAKEDIPKVFVTVEAEKIPEGAVPPEGDVYEYVVASLYDAPAESVNKSTIRFEVLSDWVNSRLSSPDLLSLYYYDEAEDEWTKLSTVFDSEKKGVCYYYADSASLGYLAIAAVPDLDPMKSSSLKSAAAEDAPAGYREESVSDATPAATAKATPLFGGMIVFVAFGLLCVIAAANRRCSKTGKK